MLSPLRRLKLIAKGVLTALKESGKITSECKAVTEERDGILYMVHLTGGTTREKTIFADCIEDMLKPVDNQRYLLMSKKGRITMEKYYCVPSIFSKTKEEATLFQKSMTSCIGAYTLIYTRNPEGRKILLTARAKAFANRNERIMNRKKKVKGALE